MTLATTVEDHEEANELIIRPQEGPQTAFCSSSADVVFYGGAAGGGKSYAILLEPTRHIDVPGFRAVIFRRTFPMITSAGGLWDTSCEIYQQIGLKPKYSTLEWENPDCDARIEFAHMQHAKNVYDWQGSQIALICFDELVHFEEGMFWYMLSRNRSTCGVRPYVRASLNPDPDTWVKRFISWWLDEKTGYPIPERDGVVRWFARERGEVYWADTKEELVAKGYKPKSFTFIAANINDNQALVSKDPDYIGNLMALPTHERARLLGGNWNARATAGSFFRREWFEVVDAAPAEFDDEVRYWDRAATEVSETSPDPDWTAGVHMRKCGGVYYVMDVRRGRLSPRKVEQMIVRTASQQPDCRIVLEEDGGQAGKMEAQYLVASLAGYDVRTKRPTKAKEIRAAPFSAQCQAGNVKVVRAPWNDDWFDELEGFPSKDVHDDQVDGSSGAFNELCETEMNTPRARY